MFAPDKKTSQALTDSNNLFQKILTDFEEDHDPETNLHLAPTFVSNTDLTPPETGKARLQKTGVGQLAFIESGGTKIFSTAQVPTLQHAYASFVGTNPVTISSQDNIASITPITPGQSVYTVVFSNLAPNTGYTVSAWAISGSVIVRYAATLRSTNSFRLTFTNTAGAPLSVINRANLTVFY